MSVIVTDTGFGSEDWSHEFHSVEALGQEVGAPAFALDLASDTDPAALEGRLDGVDLIRVDFPSSADGRGFTIARALRRMGFAGRLRAKGHVIADQYAMARRCGFDEIEIDDALAARQPEPQWLFRADWQAHDYQSRLRG
ncbi:MAG: oxidoreductase [Confluentimicrobium sp.]|nr:oxidoreductase [Actibacterium sp.]